MNWIVILVHKYICRIDKSSFANTILSAMVSLDAYLPNFTVQKPRQEISSEELAFVLRNGAIVNKKYNGNRCHILIGKKSKAQAFSIGGTVNISPCIPDLLDNISCLGLPEHSYIDAELYVPNDVENPEDLQPILGAGDFEKGAKAARELKPKLAVFDTAFLAGQPIYSLGYGKRLDLVKNLAVEDFFHVTTEVTIESYAQGLNLVRSKRWEGLVIWDKEAPNVVNFNGNVKRGRAWKLKDRITEDLLAVGWNPTKATVNLGVGSLKVSEWANDTWQAIGDIGSFEVTFDRFKAMTDSYPYRIEVSHFGRDSRGKLLFPKIIRKRTDLSVTSGE